jgi:hypothetical protein
VGKTGVPQFSDDPQAVVDDLLVDLGFAELDRAVEELGDKQVLPFRRDLHEPVRGRAR